MYSVFLHILLLQPQSRTDKIPVDRNEYTDEAEHYTNANPERDVGDAEEAVAEAVDEVEQRIDVRDVLRELGERVNGIKNAAEIDEWLQDERGDDVDAVERFCIDTVDEASERKEDGGKDREEQNDKQIVNRKREASEKHSHY